MIRRIIIIAVIVCLAAGWVLSVYKFPKKVDVVRPAVSFSENDPSSVEHVSIHVKGTVYRPIFRKRTFNGEVTIDPYDFTKENQSALFYLDRHNGVNMGTIAYQSTTKPYKFVKLSTVWFDDRFEAMNMWTNWGEGEEGDKSTTMFIVTASTYEEAVSVQSQLREKYGSDGFVPQQ